jgi:hypothetical protein
MAAGTPVDVQLADRADDRTLTALADRVAGAVVGWRLMLAGPEVDVLAARAVAVAGGALDAELRIAVTGGQHRRGAGSGPSPVPSRWIGSWPEAAEPRGGLSQRPPPGRGPADTLLAGRQRP